MSSIRLLLLGVLAHHETTYGYEVRRELESWHAEFWANIAYGSIYSALTTMAREGLVVVMHEGSSSRGPARKRYRITEAGRQAFQALLRDAWQIYKPAKDPFQVALTFMKHLPREEIVALLVQRITAIRGELATLDAVSTAVLGNPTTPSHIKENVALHAAQMHVDLAWSEAMLGKVKRHELP